jgi:hypothetical protein
VIGGGVDMAAAVPAARRAETRGRGRSAAPGRGPSFERLPQPGGVRRRGRIDVVVGRRAEQVQVTELADADKAPVIEAYLERWRWEVGAFFPDLPEQPTTDDLRAIAPGYPVFRITTQG